MIEGIYIGPAGQFVLVEWGSGPGFMTGGLFYTVEGTYYCEIDSPIEYLLNGFEYLGEL